MQKGGLKRMRQPDASHPEKSSRSVMDLAGRRPKTRAGHDHVSRVSSLGECRLMKVTPRMSPGRMSPLASYWWALLCPIRDFVSGELWKARDVASGVPLKVRDVASRGACIVAATAHDVT